MTMVYIDPTNVTNSGNNSYWFTPPQPAPPNLEEPQAPPEAQRPGELVNIALELMVVSPEEDISAFEDRGGRYNRNYTPGRYITLVIVYEGRVLVDLYNELGKILGRTVALTSGERLIQEGYIKAAPEVEDEDNGLDLTKNKKDSTSRYGLAYLDGSLSLVEL